MKNQDISSGFKDVDSSKNAQFFIEFVDKANLIPDVIVCKEKIQSLLNLHNKSSVLDIGCGTGQDVYSLAKGLGNACHVVGIDNSSVMVDTAISRYSKFNLPIEFLLADVHSLDFPDNSFDACRTERTFMHLENPIKALTEICRVTRPSGRIAIFDFDWDATIIHSSNLKLTRKIIHLLSDNIKNGTIGRTMPSLFSSVGLNNLTIIPQSIILDLQFSKLVFSGILNKIIALELLSKDELDSWWLDLEKLQQEKTFFVAMTGFIFCCSVSK